MTNNQKEVKELTSVQDITSEFIEDFGAKASEEDYEWIANLYEKCVEEKGERYYFADFRSKFVEKFFPELLRKNKTNKKPSFKERMAKKRAEQQNKKEEN